MYVIAISRETVNMNPRGRFTLLRSRILVLIKPQPNRLSDEIPMSVEPD